MPSKSRKVASRQAELRRRRRRTKGGGQQFDAGPTESSEPQVSAVVGPDADLEDSPAPDALDTQTDDGTIAGEQELATAAPVQRSRRAARRAQAAAAEMAPEYPYLGAELKRVGLIASAMMIALIVLTIFLR